MGIPPFSFDKDALVFYKGGAEKLLCWVATSVSVGQDFLVSFDGFDEVIDIHLQKYGMF